MPHLVVQPARMLVKHSKLIKHSQQISSPGSSPPHTSEPQHAQGKQRSNSEAQRSCRALPKNSSWFDGEKSTGLADRRTRFQFLISVTQKQRVSTSQPPSPRLQGGLGHLRDSFQFRELQDLGTKEPRAHSAKGFTVTCGFCSFTGVGISCHLDAGMQRFDYFGVCFHCIEAEPCRQPRDLTGPLPSLETLAEPRGTLGKRAVPAPSLPGEIEVTCLPWGGPAAGRMKTCSQGWQENNGWKQNKIHTDLNCFEQSIGDAADLQEKPFVDPSPRSSGCHGTQLCARGIKTKWRVHLTPSFSIPALCTTETHKASRIHEIELYGFKLFHVGPARKAASVSYRLFI
ncbi:PREDICTED: uncharacterized protein LOC102248812 [Myotis brandtii]|uniref:uncharacterized protein LOC102248812 n=1 Tax=Myotis brandtii TaxID=109478 RepID=UPI0007041356|nr:PREDICTED: uncharacterized protein LOC102248812 [Myotis brandtii]